ncbi:MAG: LLM class flavin-dependent oxidoreductase [Dehalococcoidia bacterium]|nr:LLM class flavin-dependent oxidoreductase [Dehalococcoidia bacterium]
MHKISIGVNWQGHLDLAATIEEARIADDSGVHLMSVAEAWGRDAFVILTALAGATSRVHLGTSIVNIFSRSPAALAQAFITLDTYFGHRMVIGVGSSGPQVIEHFHGVKFDRPLQRMREYIEIINSITAAEPLHYHGKIFNLDRGFTMRDHQPPADRRHIPIHVASITPKSIEQTAEIADGWIPIFVPRDQWGAQIKIAHDALRAAGRETSAFDIRSGGSVTVTDNPDGAYQKIREGAAFYIAQMGDFYYEHFLRIGLADEANTVRAAWREGGSKAGIAAIPDDLARSLGYAGPVEGCIEWLDAQQEAGYTIHGVSIDERDPKKRAEIYRKLVG